MSLRHLAFDDSGYVLSSSLTNTYQTVLALADDVDVLWLFNQTDVAVVVKLPSGYSGTAEIRLPSGSSMTIDCRSNSKRLAKGAVQVKYASEVPTIGEFCVTVAR